VQAALPQNSHISRPLLSVNQLYRYFISRAPLSAAAVGINNLFILAALVSPQQFYRVALLPARYLVCLLLPADSGNKALVTRQLIFYHYGNIRNTLAPRCRPIDRLMRNNAT
jgi:hypothetical protein